MIVDAIDAVSRRAIIELLQMLSVKIEVLIMVAVSCSIRGISEE